MLIYLLLAIILGIAKGDSICRCTPDDDCWPTSAKLKTLQSKLSDSAELLYDIRPPAHVCHGTDFDADACAFVRDNWANDMWRTNVPGAAVSPIMESEAPYRFNSTASLACDYSTPFHGQCGQGQVPQLGVAVGNEYDIAASLEFARRHRLRVVIKNTGHDMLGRSMGANTFMIWTHKLKNRQIENEFTPTGCKQDATVRTVLRIGAGVQWSEAYDAVSTSSNFVVGGLSINGTVGAAGGWLAGGGHSPVSPSYGLGVDNVVQMRVVLPALNDHSAERVLNVSACSYPDLFWALRGGGGGTFGVVTEVVYKTHRDTPGLLAEFSASTKIMKEYQKMVNAFFRSVPSLSRSYWGGYAMMTPSLKSGTSGNNRVSLIMYRANVTDGHVLKEANATMHKLFSSLSDAVDFKHEIADTQTVSSWKEGMVRLEKILSSSGHSVTINRKRDQQSQYKGASSGSGETMINVANQLVGSTSRLLSEETLHGTSPDTLAELASVSVMINCLVGGAAVSQQRVSAASLHPNWRSTLVETIASPLSASQLSNVATELFRISGKDGGAAYLNEAGYFDPYWPKSFWGSHYERLLSIKRKYDPEDQLLVMRGVGSDRWNDDLICPKESDQ